MTTPGPASSTNSSSGPPPAAPDIAPEIFRHFTTLDCRPKWLCLGDSITEQGSLVQGWVSCLQSVYTRRVDVINRGFSGYTSRWALAALPYILKEWTGSDIRLVVLALGANDAALASGPSAHQFTPVEEYGQNLLAISQALQETLRCKIIWVTPPPIDDRVRAMGDRTLANTKVYAEKCRKMASEAGVPVIDAWQELQNVPDWTTRYLNDGLHLTPEGNRVLYDLIQREINQLGLNVEAVPRQYPDSLLINGARPEENFPSMK